MTPGFRNVLVGTGAAVAIAFPLMVPEIGSIATWKIMLALAGLGLFAIAGTSKSA